MSIAKVPRHELMKQLAEHLQHAYELAGHLRDRCDLHEKDLFNEIRRQTYGLDDKARDRYYEWKPEAN